MLDEHSTTHIKHLNVGILEHSESEIHIDLLTVISQ